MGGTFDPVTLGHTAAACAVRDALGCTVELLPNRQSPFKSAPSDDAHRLAMLALACAEHEGLSVNPIELTLAPPSYSVRTLEHLAGEEPLVFCLGTDAFAQVDRWQSPHRLLELAGVVVLGRPGFPLPARPHGWPVQASLTEFK
ncbi:MAG: nicotinate-nicotinamide nucleotide adenylyltransferase, partial [Litorivicinus sp.]